MKITVSNANMARARARACTRATQRSSRGGSEEKYYAICAQHKHSRIVDTPRKYLYFMTLHTRVCARAFNFSKVIFVRAPCPPLPPSLDINRARSAEQRCPHWTVSTTRCPLYCARARAFYYVHDFPFHRREKIRRSNGGRGLTRVSTTAKRRRLAAPPQFHRRTEKENSHSASVYNK